MKKYRRAIALFLAIGLMVLIPSGMGVSASGNTVEAKMSENIAQVLSMTGIVVSYTHLTLPTIDSV